MFHALLYVLIMLLRHHTDLRLKRLISHAIYNFLPVSLGKPVQSTGLPSWHGLIASRLKWIHCDHRQLFHTWNIYAAMLQKSLWTVNPILYPTKYQHHLLPVGYISCPIHHQTERISNTANLVNNSVLYNGNCQIR